MSKITLVFILLVNIGFLTSSCSHTEAQKRNTSVDKAITNIDDTSNIADNQQDSTKHKKEQLVKISTDYGDMIIKLYNETPKHRDNFIKLVKEGFYNGTIFHRVIKGFMIQGGDPQSRNPKPGVMYGNGGPGYTIPAEFNKQLFHKKGALAAAREGDAINPTKASSGSQFYIVQGRTFTNMELTTLGRQMGRIIPADQKEVYETLGGTPFLDMNYTVFGEVIMGMDVIDKIAAVKTLRGDRPVKDIKMTVSLIDD